MNSRILYKFLIGICVCASWYEVVVHSAAAWAGPVSGCKRTNNVGYWAISGELTKVNATCSGVLLCTGGIDNIEIKVIADWGDTQQWLWSGTSNSKFSIAQQDAILSNAKALAGTVSPPGKSLVGIAFFPDVTVGSASTYYLGANLKFGDCKQVADPS